MEPRKKWHWNTACLPAKEAASDSAHCLGSHLAHKLPGQEGSYFQEELFTCDRLLSERGMRPKEKTWRGLERWLSGLEH